MLHLRDLRHAVEIQVLTASTGAGTRGQSQSVFVTAETVQASIRPLAGREASQARAIWPTATHLVEMYYTPNAQPRSRLKFGDRYLNIAGVVNVEERGRWVQLTCIEEVST